MTTTEQKLGAVAALREMWEPEAVERVVNVCAKQESFDGNTDAFLTHCYACGGDWGQLLLTGIRALWSEVWEAIPDDMGMFAFSALCQVLILCGVDTAES